MADIVSPEKRSLMMAGIRGKNTRPELKIRQLLHKSGFRFRLHKKNLPGKPDIVLPKHNVIIFVQGCYWHGHENCALFRLPKTRVDFWQKKITANIERDDNKLTDLIKLGWRVLYVWECASKGKNRLTDGTLIDLLSGFILGSESSFSEIRGTLS